jgi:ribosomal small subunit protein bTHX
MGKGDKKSKKGKRWKGSYGVTRNRAAIKARLKRETSKKSEAAAATTEAPSKPRRTSRKKSEA